jgi:hypothetical protein
MHQLLVLALLLTAPEPSKLVCGEWQTIAVEGGGQWDLTVKRNTVDGNPYGQPHGQALSNEGLLYLCDTCGDRVLVFTLKGEPLDVITWSGLDHPLGIWPIAQDTIVLSSVDNGQDVQWWVTKTPKGWTYQPLREAVPALRGVASKETLTPVWRNGQWRFLQRDPDSQQLTLIDPANGEAVAAPTEFWDSVGRFWRAGPEHTVLVHDSEGSLIAAFPADVGVPVCMLGHVYFSVQRFPEEPASAHAPFDLVRFSPDGTVQNRIEVLCDRRAVRIVSPDQSRVAFISGSFAPDGILRIEAAEGTFE